MPLIVLSALVAAAAQPYGPASVDDLTQAFAAICMRQENPLEGIDASAAAMRFRPVELIPSNFNPETKAWRLAGVRLFQTAGQKEGWPVLPTCGVTGDIGHIKNDKEVLAKVGEPLGLFGYAGQSGPKGSKYHSFSQRGIIDVAIDKRDKSHVILSFLWQVGQPAPTVSR